MTLEARGFNSGQDLEEELANGDPDQHDDFDNESELGSHPDDDDTDRDTPIAPTEVEEWIELAEHPMPTGTRIVRALKKVARSGRNNLTVLIIGKAAVGKSTTINSLFASDVVEVTPFSELTPDRPYPFVIRKRAADVAFTVIDAQGLLETDQVSEGGIRRIASQTRNYAFDAVVFIDRFDIPRPDELDYQIMKRLTRTFGKQFWPRMIIGLTRADPKDIGPGLSYTDVVQKRVEGIREIMRNAGGYDAPLPYVLIENSESCKKNSSGEKILHSQEAWVPAMFEQIVETALCFNQAYKYNPKTVHQREDFITRFCFIPVILMIQILVKLLIIDRVIQEDGLRGDKYGPFDQDQRDHARAKFNALKKAEKKRTTKTTTTTTTTKQHRKKEVMTLEDELSSEESEDEFNIDES
eukprot:g6381.t1